MHDNLYAFVHTAAESFALGGPVYEFGFSPLDVPGFPSLRDCFPDAPYMGCQLFEEVVLAHPKNFACLPFADHSAQTIVCLDLFERLPHPLLAMREFTRVLKPGGAMVIGASAENLPATGDIGRLQPRFLREVLSGLEATLAGWQGDIDDPYAIYGIGFKRPTSAVALSRIPSFLTKIRRRLGATAFWPRRLAHMLAWWLGVRHPWLGRGCGEVEFLLDLPGTCRWPSSGVIPAPHHGKACQRQNSME
jgi:SAM-dependent methyltransferase